RLRIHLQQTPYTGPTAARQRRGRRTPTRARAVQQGNRREDTKNARQAASLRGRWRRTDHDAARNCRERLTAAVFRRCRPRRGTLWPGFGLLCTLSPVGARLPGNRFVSLNGETPWPPLAASLLLL